MHGEIPLFTSDCRRLILVLCCSISRSKDGYISSLNPTCMKALRLITLSALVSAFFITSCQQDATREETASFRNEVIASHTDEVAQANKTSDGPCNSSVYEVILESRIFTGGNWEWTWSVRNSNPGNGNNGTAKDLSHWGFQTGTCFNAASLVSAAYSADGITWTNVPPVIQPEVSQSCLTTPVLKFDFGTTGTAKSYYRVVISEDYAVGNAFAYYKSGQQCCTFNFAGIDCSGPVEIEIVE
jgi:hypothetical protein